MARNVALSLKRVPRASDGRIVLDPPGDGNCGWTVLLGILVALFETFDLVTALGLPASADDLRVIIRGKPDGPPSKHSAAAKEATSYHIDLALEVVRMACLWDEPLQFLRDIRVEHETFQNSGISGHWVATVPSRDVAEAFCKTPRPASRPPLSCLAEHFRIAREARKAIDDSEVALMFSPANGRVAKKVAPKPSKASGSSKGQRTASDRDEQIANDLAIARLMREDETLAAQRKRAQEASDASLAVWTSRRK